MLWWIFSVKNGDRFKYSFLKSCWCCFKMFLILLPTSNKTWFGSLYCHCSDCDFVTCSWKPTEMLVLLGINSWFLAAAGSTSEKLVQKRLCEDTKDTNKDSCNADWLQKPCQEISTETKFDWLDSMPKIGENVKSKVLIHDICLNLEGKMSPPSQNILDPLRLCLSADWNSCQG